MANIAQPNRDLRLEARGRRSSIVEDSASDWHNGGLADKALAHRTTPEEKPKSAQS